MHTFAHKKYKIIEIRLKMKAQWRFTKQYLNIKKSEIMNIKFFNTSESDKRLKATIHTTGKLGFSADAIDLLGINENKSIAFGQNQDDPLDTNLYAIIYEGKNENAIKISKAGAYYYVNTKSLFDKIGIDYKNVKIMFDIIKIEENGNEILKFSKREGKKKTLKNDMK